MSATRPPLVLASTSRYRRDLLARLGLAFETARPDVDETPLPGEAPAALVCRLAQAKATAIQADGAWVLGSDQAAELGGVPLGKPGDMAGAQAQLAAMSGRAVAFHTAVCLRVPGQPPRLATDITTVRMRALTPQEIDRYLRAEMPFDCAGSFKAEGLGITLFESIDSSDPTGLIGLPLIATARLLREAGLALP